jgi:hypothetical protein
MSPESSGFLNPGTLLSGSTRQCCTPVTLWLVALNQV